MAEQKKEQQLQMELELNTNKHPSKSKAVRKITAYAESMKLRWRPFMNACRQFMRMALNVTSGCG